MAPVQQTRPEAHPDFPSLQVEEMEQVGPVVAVVVGGEGVVVVQEEVREEQV